MKRYIFYRDKKLSMLLLFYILISLLSSIWSMVFNSYGFSSLLGPFFIFIMIIIFYLSFGVYSLENNHILAGMIFIKFIDLKTIKKIVTIKNKMILYTGDDLKGKKIKINLLILKSNPDRYTEFFKDIKGIINTECKIDDTSSSIINGNEQISDDRLNKPGLKIGGWLNCLVVVILFYLVVDLFSLTDTIAKMIKGSFYVSFETVLLNVVLTGVIVIFAATTLIMILKKKKPAILFTKHFFFWYAIYIIVNNVIETISFSAFSDISVHLIGLLVFSAVSVILRILVVNRYMNTSQRVKNTFIFKRRL